MNDNMKAFDNCILTFGVNMTERRMLKETAIDIIDILRKKNFRTIKQQLLLNAQKL